MRLDSIDLMSRDQTVSRSGSDRTQQTRRAIVDAALTTFLERGFSATRMTDVADRAGVAKGTLYLYFDDKVALFEGVVGEMLSSPGGRGVLAEPEPHESTRAFLSRVVTPMMRDLERSRRAALIRLVLAEGGRFPTLVDSCRRCALDPILAFTERLAKRAVERGEISSDALTRFPALLMAPGLVATVWNGLPGAASPLAPATLFEAYLDLVFGPLTPAGRE